MAERAACTPCRRRSWLIAELSVLLEYRSRDIQRLRELLALEDEPLLSALAGRRREELRARYASFDRPPSRRAPGVAELCRHDPRYPPRLRALAAPPLLHLRGGIEPLARLTNRPAVALVGSAAATDYGLQTARDLARGLAASGVTVAAALVDGIGAAALEGALEADGASLAIVPGSLDRAPARHRPLLARVGERGCAASELACGARSRSWPGRAALRMLAALALVTVVVEARDEARELDGVRLARELGCGLGAVPGRVSSPFSRGSHLLLKEGACLITDAGDVLEQLSAQCSSGTRVAAAEPARSAARSAALEPRLARTLERVRAGRDTPGKLIAHDDSGEVLLALSRLELMGLLVRGEGGRYVPRG